MIIMASGVIFYWFSWILLVIVTFLMQKKRIRTLLACWLFISIICSNFYVTVERFHVSITFLILFLGSILLLVRLPHLIYHLFSSFTITIGYAAIHLWEMNAPVWIVFPRLVTMSLILGLMTIILVKDFYGRLAICIFGTVCGELIYSLILSSYGMSTAIGRLIFFDCILSVVLILIFLNVFYKIQYKLFLFIHNYKKQVEELIIR